MGFCFRLRRRIVRMLLVMCILGDPGAVSRAGRRDESFQARAEKPLDTDSHRTISKRSSECWLLIGDKKCFVSLCPIGEQFLLRSFRELAHDGYCCYYLAKVARFVHQAFLTRQRNYWWSSRKTFRMLSAGAIQFALRKFCLWRITMYRK